MHHWQQSSGTQVFPAAPMHEDDERPSWFPLIRQSATEAVRAVWYEAYRPNHRRRR